MGIYKLYVVTSFTTLGGGAAIVSDVIEFSTKEDALFAAECLRMGKGIQVILLFRTLDGKS